MSELFGRTLAGLAFNELGRRPQEGDEGQVGGVLLRVEQLDGHRITRLLVSVEGDRWHAVAGSESRKTRDDESSGCR